MGTDKDTQVSNYKKVVENKNYIIRKCTFEDLELVKEVNEAELPEDYPFFFYKSILDNYPDSFLIAFLKDDPAKIIGYVMWRIERNPAKNSLRFINKGHLVSIAVSKGYRRLGIATELLIKSMPEIKKFNIDEYVLEVRVSNFGAISLYKNFHFKSDGVKKKYYRDGENAYYMVLKIEED
jgi:ribosomal-protein-alanine N-acetyltransferase